MAHRSIKFGFNHMVAPSLTPEELVDAAVTPAPSRSNCATTSAPTASRSRNRPPCQRQGQGSRDRNRTINALYPFNIWNEELALQTESLAKLAAACGAEGPRHVPAQPRKDARRDARESRRSARRAKQARAILIEHGLKGFVEPLGFPVSSLRFKREALAAIDDIRGADVFSFVHDTFHHRGAGRARVPPPGPVSCTFRGSMIHRSASPTCWMGTACSSAPKIGWVMSSNSGSSMPTAMTGWSRSSRSPRKSMICPTRRRGSRKHDIRAEGAGGFVSSLITLRLALTQNTWSRRLCMAGRPLSCRALFRNGLAGGSQTGDPLRSVQFAALAILTPPLL